MNHWKIDLTYIVEWLRELPHNQYADTMAALKYLAQVGPSGGRPSIDRIHSSHYQNLKELRPRNSAKHIRILFIFDPSQEAIMLLAGDKSGNWDKWYKQNIPKAEAIYQEHLKNTFKKGNSND